MSFFTSESACYMYYISHFLGAEIIHIRLDCTYGDNSITAVKKTIIGMAGNRMLW